MYWRDSYRQKGKFWGKYLTSLDLPTWHQRTMSLDWYSKYFRIYYARPYFTFTRSLDDYHKLDSYFHHWWVDYRTKWYVDYYDSNVNEANKSPLYDAELFRIRYGFNPYASNLTSYGVKLDRLNDYIERENVYNTLYNTDHIDTIIVS